MLNNVAGLPYLSKSRAAKQRNPGFTCSLNSLCFHIILYQMALPESGNPLCYPFFVVVVFFLTVKSEGFPRMFV